MTAATHAHSSDREEWYTPSKILAPVRQVFGGSINLDPASCELANTQVQAKRIFTKKDPAGVIACPWADGTFLNPPYDRAGAQWRFADKAETESWANPGWQIIGLWRASVEAHGFAPLWRATQRCFVRGRLSFDLGVHTESECRRRWLDVREGSRQHRLLSKALEVGEFPAIIQAYGPAGYPSVVVYWGPRPEAFEEAFAPLGEIV